MTIYHPGKFSEIAVGKHHANVVARVIDTGAEIRRELDFETESV